MEENLTRDDYMVMSSISASKKFALNSPCVKNYVKVKKNYLANLSNTQYQLFSPDSKVIRKLRERREREKLEEAKRTVERSKNLRSRIINISFFCLNIIVIALILFFQARKNGISNPGKIGANWWYILAAFGMFGLFMVAEQLSFMTLTHKATGILRPNLSYKTSAIGKYYDVITPFSSGGQPFQIYYLHKYGVKTGKAVSVTLAKYIFKQIACAIFYSVILIINFRLQVVGSSTEQTLVGAASWIGYGIMMILLIVTILVSNNKKIGSWLVVGGLKFLKKLHLIKDYPKTFRSVIKGVRNWHNTMKAYRTSPYIIIFNVIIGIGGSLAQYTGPFFIYCAFEGWDPSMWIDIVAMSVIVDLAASFIPLPGGTGMAEISFVALFSSLFAPGNVFWALIIWRCYSYYVFIVQGLALIIYDFAIGERRLKKHKEKWNKPRFKISI